jgi:hypothetical protein
MASPSSDPLRELLHHMTARYIRVLPDGLDIDGALPLRKSIDATILAYGGARTLYHAKQPVCRSLDGVRAVKDPHKSCSDCYDKKYCTPQVRVDLMFDGLPYRLLLAFSSGKNFLLYVGTPERSQVLSRIVTRIRVIHRGSWGELAFENLGPC